MTPVIILSVVLGFAIFFLICMFEIDHKLRNRIKQLEQLNTESCLEEEKAKDEYNQLVKGLRKLLGDEP